MIYWVGTIANRYSAVWSNSAVWLFIFGRPVFIYSAVWIRPYGLDSIHSGAYQEWANIRIYFWNDSHAIPMQRVWFSPKLSYHRIISLALYLPIFLLIKKQVCDSFKDKSKPDFISHFFLFFNKKKNWKSGIFFPMFNLQNWSCLRFIPLVGPPPSRTP